MAGKPAPAGHNEAPRPIIVKKVTVVAAAGHHGGAWKVAYADFVTAMMAFFLLMWLLGATTEQQRRGLADYFAPTLMKTSQDGGGGQGFFGGSSITDVDKYPNRAGQTGTKSITIPRAATGGPKEGSDAVMKRMQQRLEAKLAQRQQTRKLLSQVKMVQTSEGIRIDLVDDADFSMFALGTTVLTPDAQALIAALATSILPEGGELTLRGHTDALPWRSRQGGNNWALSTGRAEATRQALLRNGIGETRFKRIEGVADRELLIKEDPGDPRNRRISILMGR